MTKEAKIALKLTGIILDYFGLKEGVYSKLKQIWDFSVEITEDSKLDEKQKFIIKLTQGITAFLKRERAEDIEPKLEYTFSNHFDLQELMRCYDDHDKFSRYLIDKSWTRLHRNEDEFVAYERAVKFVVNAIYENLNLFNVSKETEIASLEILFSLKQMQESFGDVLSDVNFMAHYRGSLAEYLDSKKLPKKNFNNNKLHYLNPKVNFHGREKETDIINVFLHEGELFKDMHIHIWGITGPGGIGKSKFARHIADMHVHDMGVVWLEENNDIQQILDISHSKETIKYDKPILFICDYADSMEKKIIELVKYMDNTGCSVYFLLLERSKYWYTNFVRENDIIQCYALHEEPLDLLVNSLSKEASFEILDEFVVQYKRSFTEEEKQKIYDHAKSLADHDRCLFLLLTADAYITKNCNLKGMDAQKLLHNYIERTKKLLTKKYNNPKLIRSVYRLFALATALNGLNLEESYSNCIQYDIDIVREELNHDSSKVEKLLKYLSERYIGKCIIPPLLPDCVGEVLFIDEFIKLFDDFSFEWLDMIYNKNYEYISRCLQNKSGHSNFNEFTIRIEKYILTSFEEIVL